MKTFIPKSKDITKKWYIIDAQRKTLGRLASRIAFILRGKHKPIFTPHLNLGDFVVVNNVEKMVVTGKKLEQKIYYSHSGYPGGLKSISLEKMFSRTPEKVLWRAVYGMLPANKLRKELMRKLKIYRGEKTPPIKDLIPLDI